MKAFSCERGEGEKFEAKNDEIFKVGKKVAIWNGGFYFIINFGMNTANAAIIYYGAVLHNDGELSIGDISAFLLYMIQLIMNFAIISIVFGNVFKVIGASEKIVLMMKWIPFINPRGGKTIPEEKVTGEIEIRNVTFRYPSKPDVTVAKNVCIKVETNKVVALVGQSGCGKSSMISLIERFYDPIEGQVLFSGVDIKELDPKWYKSQISIV